MFDFLGVGKATSAVAGAGVGAVTTHVIHKVTTGRKLTKAEDRLGGGKKEDIEKAIRKVAILKTLALKDNVISPEEKNYLYKYILNDPHLPADKKIELANEIDEPLPDGFKKIFKTITTSNNFTNLFSTEEEASGFTAIMLKLGTADGNLDNVEKSYIKEIRQHCTA